MFLYPHIMIIIGFDSKRFCWYVRNSSYQRLNRQVPLTYEINQATERYFLIAKLICKECYDPNRYNLDKGMVQGLLI